MLQNDRLKMSSPVEGNINRLCQPLQVTCPRYWLQSCVSVHWYMELDSGIWIPCWQNSGLIKLTKEHPTNKYFT